MQVGRGACDHEVGHTFGVRSQTSDVRSQEHGLVSDRRSKIVLSPGPQARLPSPKGRRDTSRGPLSPSHSQDAQRLGSGCVAVEFHGAFEAGGAAGEASFDEGLQRLHELSELWGQGEVFILLRDPHELRSFGRVDGFNDALDTLIRR